MLTGCANRWKQICGLVYKYPLYEHIQNCHVQPSNLQSGKKIQAMCVSDKIHAKEIANVLLPQLRSGSTQECFPGNCLLGRELLQNNIPLTLWEPRLSYKGDCQELKRNYSVVLNTKSLLNRKTFIPFVANTKSGCLQNLIVPFSSQFHSFLYCILTNLNDLNWMTEISLFLWMPQSDLKDFMGDTCEPILERKGASLLSLCLPITFESQVLLKVPLSAFSDMVLKKSHDNHLYLVKTKVSSIPRHLDSKKFLDFLKLIHLHRAKRLIPELEQFCPGIGLELIKMGYTTRNKLKHIIPKDIYHVYELIASKQDQLNQN